MVVHEFLIGVSDRLRRLHER